MQDALVLPCLCGSEQDSRIRRIEMCNLPTRASKLAPNARRKTCLQNRRNNSSSWRFVPTIPKRHERNARLRTLRKSSLRLKRKTCQTGFQKRKLKRFRSRECREGLLLTSEPSRTFSTSRWPPARGLCPRGRRRSSTEPESWALAAPARRRRTCSASTCSRG